MKERPREKLERLGPAGLQNAELLALLLRTGYKGRGVEPLSQYLFKKYPEKSLFEMSYSHLSKIKGLGRSKAATILAGYELAKRLMNNSNRIVISNPKESIAQINEIRARKKEHFVALYLNARNELLHREFISIGILDASLVHPREVFAPALEHRACSIVLSHNHPSGNANPSNDDRELTSRLIESGKILGIEIVDHIVVTENDYYSFKENDII
ncbi:MAG: DNA repair protein RadC [Elusimicrobia bacterium]|nr:DNA repair protein RadC [Elusimicrobiota bacterium]